MSPAAMRTRPKVLLAGNPNTGKTTLFNRLTGAELRVGNYPGVTVECITRELVLDGGVSVELTDLPGAYSLSARSAEEQIALQALCGLDPYPKPELAVLVIDATQLARNLYFTLQVIEAGVPVVCALNMQDELASRGVEVDRERLEQRLGVPVVAVSAKHGQGLAELGRAVAKVLEKPSLGQPGPRWRPEEVELRADVEAVGQALPAEWTSQGAARTEALALWALLSIDEQDELGGIDPELRRTVMERRRMAQEAGRDLDQAVVAGRYGWIDRHAPEFLEEQPERRSWSERVDALILHPLAGFFLFLLTMGVVFQFLFSWSDPLIGGIESLFAWIAEGIEALLPAGLFRDFLVEGIVGGVGSVVVFLPQILLLFLFLGLMEDSGYMARVAFLMDRIMKALGLHGRAFVPLMSGFACAIPAMMGTRTIERKRDRFLTMMVIPLMTCAARLPVYSLIIAALFPPGEIWGFVPVQGLLMVGMYVFGTVIALVCAAVLGRTLFRGPRVPLILELPPYRLPKLRYVLRMMWQRARLFLSEAGKVILAFSVLLWILLTFPREPALERDFGAERNQLALQELSPAELEEKLLVLDDAESGERLRASYAGRLGQALEPWIEPLGFDWKIGIGLIGSFAAREVFVATMGVVYGVGGEVDEQSPNLRDRIRAESRSDGKPTYTPLVGLSLMIFFALACQCMSTLAVLKRETKSYRWPVFLFVYMTVLAWVSSFFVYQGGLLLGFG